MKNYTKNNNLDAVIIGTADFQHALHAVQKNTFDEEGREIIAGNIIFTY